MTPQEEIKEHYSDVNDSELVGITELYLWEDGDYDRSLFAVFKQNDKWFVVEDGHCSCNGYESWCPQEITLKQLEKELEDESMFVSSILSRREILETVKKMAVDTKE